MAACLIMLAVAVGLSIPLTVLVRRLGRKLGILDSADGVRKFQRRPVPRTGGVAIYAAFFGSVGLSLLTGQSGGVAGVDVLSLFCGASGIVAIGLWDDAVGLRPRWKLLFSALVGAAMWAAGWRIDIMATPFGQPLELGVWSAPVTLVWFLACINATNFIDGLDGLAGGVAVFVCAALAVSGFVLGNGGGALLAVALGGAALGFLLFNFNPASIFLGDSGSYLLGFLIACIALRTGKSPEAGVELAGPVAAMGLPAFDTALAVVRRWSRRLPVLSGSDRRHVHHRLLDAGLSQRQAALVLYAVTLALANCAVLMTAIESIRGVMLLVLCAAGVAAAWCVGREELVDAAKRMAGRASKRPPST